MLGHFGGHAGIGPALTVTLLAAALLELPVAAAAGQRARLVEARNLAYDANYRNDAEGLRLAITALQPLADARGEEGAYVKYYLSWAYWALASSQVQASDTAGAVASGKLSVEHARAALAIHDEDPEFYTALVNGLVVVGFLDRSQTKTVLPELQEARRRALQLGPENPRVVLMDAGAIFNSPPESGGSRERGIARWMEAIALLEAEANATAVDPITPRWGYALAQGWLASLYLSMTPPERENARAAAEAALRLRPDFWWVRTQVQPQLRE